jgi:hypothetical protein
MRSDAADEASYRAEGADDVEPIAFVGMSVNMPAECFFQDDAMPPNCPKHGVGLLTRYVPGRRNNAPYYNMLVTHAQ